VILSIAQTTDGYLWLGSLSGLFRFDGSRFEQFQPPYGGHLPSNEIASLLALPDGSLWIGFIRGGASLLKNGRITTYGEKEGLPAGRLAAFVRDQSGTMWAAVHSGGLARFEGGVWKQVGPDWNFPGKNAQSAFVDRAGTLWVATDDTVVFLPSGAKAFHATGEHITVVCQIAQAPDGKLWLAETPKNARPL
jgi:ligand-binding sensor domain-containing protein